MSAGLLGSSSGNHLAGIDGSKRLGKLTALQVDRLEGGDKLYESCEEGSHLKEYSFKITGGAGKYERASGGGTYT